MKFPFFSIVIPTYDRPEELKACLEAIQRLDYPRNRFEVILVDDGSSIPVKMSGEGFPEAIRITVLRQKNAGPASARNAGSRQAWGEILAFTDDDCRPSPQWLRELAETFHRTPTALVGGRTLNGLDGNRYSTASQIIVEEAYSYFFPMNSPLRFFASNNLAFPANLFHEQGGFDASFRISEDRDVCHRWIHHGLKLVYAPEAIVHHYHDLTFATFCKQHFHYGRGAYLFYRRREGGRRSFLKPDPRFYGSVFRRAVFSPSTGSPFRMAGLMGLWQMANVAGFLYQGITSLFSSFLDSHKSSFLHKKILHRENHHHKR